MAIREVIFRGKQTDNGEWIEGAYSPFNLNFFGEREEKPHIIIISDDKNIDGLWCEVIPETVGQYTGLTDKNGKKIFEGDIVDYISSDVIGNPKTGTIIVEDMTDYDTMIYLNHSDELQIIGNIYDNPELLGGENNGINR